MGIEGVVELVVTVNIQGTVDDLQVKSSSGSTLLDKAAIKAIRQWRFKPASMGNVPLSSTIVIPVVFKLE
jgi:protein TonB